jgi:hypothetical protein
MASESEDEDLRKAIALSLQQNHAQEVVDLASDGEDGAVSPQARVVQSRTAASAASAEPPAPGPTRHAYAGILGLDRKKMEEERLARTRKRKSSISPPPLQRMHDVLQQHSHTSVSVQTSVTEASNKRTKTSASAQYHASSSGTENPTTSEQTHEVRGSLKEVNPSTHLRSHAPPSRSVTTLLGPGIQFPAGIVRKTWAFGYPREGDIKIEEVLQKGDLELAVLSAFQWDEEWILRKLDLTRTKVICVVQAKGELQKTQIRANAPSMIDFCFPSMAGQINCMHSKLQLLFHPSYLRVVVPSANLTPYDWGEDGGIMENSVFIVDLPKKSEASESNHTAITPFCRELCYFLKAMGLDESVIRKTQTFDFSKTSEVAFVHSIGGAHFKSDWKRTGYCGLGLAIQELGLATKDPLNIDFVTSSIGSLNVGFLQAIYLAAQGDDGTTELSWRTNKSAKTGSGQLQLGGTRAGTEVEILRRIDAAFRIYYPTHDTVLTSKAGPAAGGTICFQSRWYDSPSFPSKLLRDCRSTREGMLMHNKLIFVRPQRPSPDGLAESGAWAYVGSANLSESAWGRLVHDKSAKQPKLNIRNWECGVVVPVASGAKLRGHGRSQGAKTNGKVAQDGSVTMAIETVEMDIFADCVPVPMVVPGEEYGSRRPWFYTER